ncbi:MAG: hypothetical protein QN183_15010 [Armatimonadota bacterium]|nr:hypothetical protein [Armatimonadota bacterium]MDR7534194.1 hypothetical protein [Armatimonadota bacterium]MDR7537653.1 hypothetical protein [Armatimonadota bacterium]
MTSVRAIALVLVVFLGTSVLAPLAARANGNHIRLTGVIVAQDAAGNFQVQELGRGTRWTVFIIRRELDDDDDDRRIRRLTPGDVVEVKGAWLGGQNVLARKITFLGRSGGTAIAVPPQPVPQAPPAVAPPAGSSNLLVTIIKTFGIGYVVRTFGPSINSFINTLLQNRGAAVQAQTKVVPILSVTIGLQTPGSAYIGAAQVSGPPAALERVQAVALLEADHQTAFRIKAYVPVDNLKPWEAFRRVPGVGVSAIIDIGI